MLASKIAFPTRGSTDIQGLLEAVQAVKRIPATLQDVSFELLPGSAFRPSDPASSARCFAAQDGSEFCPRAPDTSSLARGLAESPPKPGLLYGSKRRGKRRLESRSKVGRTHGRDPQDFKKLREAVAQCSMPKRRSFWKRKTTLLDILAGKKTSPYTGQAPTLRHTITTT